MTYFNERDTIANRSQNMKAKSFARSDRFAPFNAKSLRFSQSMTKIGVVKPELPGPGAYFEKGTHSAFDELNKMKREIISMKLYRNPVKNGSK